MAAGRGAGSERLVAVVLFTDLVGSTELRARVGEEAAEELRRTHDRLLTQAVEANSGRVVKGLGDGIMATFAGASDAVAGAVAIQQAVDRLNRPAKTPTPLAVRVGLSAGDVSVEDDDVHGTPVIEAARLCAAATGGEILASEMVRWLARGSVATFTSVGELNLKGLPEPLPTVRVDWEPAPVSTIPMPPLLTDIGRIFVGRDAELERLGQLWKEAAAGERRVALVGGEPGVGKTRLAAELATRVHDDGGVVLAGRCDKDLGVPYQPFVEALRQFVDHAATDRMPAGLGRYPGELVRLLPEVAERFPGLPPPVKSDPETERYRLFDAMAAWLVAASTEDPVFLVLDDLQWAAKPTLLLLRHLLRSPAPMRLLVVGTYRDTELAHDHPLVELVGDLRREGAVERVSLGGLDDVAVNDLVARSFGDTADGPAVALAHMIYQETEGNPFFVQEFLRHLTETGAVRPGVATWTALPIEEIGIPEGVRDVIGRRLARLSKDANRVLRVAAVTGAEFDARVIHQTEILDEDELVAALEEATAARLLVEVPGAVPRYRFAHALVRETLYHGLSAARRTTLHRRVAEAIEVVHAARLDTHLPALAHHWAHASAPAAETTRAVHYAARAGDQALAQHANDEAVSYYRQALELLGAPGHPTDAGQRMKVLILLGEAERRAGHPAYRQTLFDAAALARERGDAEALAEAAVANNRGFHAASIDVDWERVEVLEAAVEALGHDDTPLRARLLAALASELTFAPDHEYRLRLADEALAIARRVEDRPTLGHVLAIHVISTWVPTTRGERPAKIAELATLAHQLGDPLLEFWFALWGGMAAIEIADRDAAAANIDALERLAGDLGQPLMRWLVTWHTGLLARVTGEFDGAAAIINEGHSIGRAAGLPDSFRTYGAQMFLLAIDRGGVGPMLDQLRQALNRPHLWPLNAIALAYALCEEDRSEEARLLFDQVAAHDFVALPFNVMWLYSMAMLAEVCADLGDRPRGARLYERLSPHRDLVAIGGPLALGSVHHALGRLASILGRYDDAQEHFAEAARMHTDFSAHVWLARTRLEWARMLLARRQAADAEQARELLDQALATAGELSLANVERRAVALLQDGP